MFRSIVALAICLSFIAPAAAGPPSAADIVRLDVHPATLQFNSKYAAAQILVTAVLSDGGTFDCTRVAAFSPPECVKIDGTGVARPISNGLGRLGVEWQGRRVEVQVACAGVDAEPEISFVRDVMPLLAKAGCNSGTCHGAQAGKNGFKLSLRGYDPLFDHRSLTDDLEGRRFNRVAPEQSLMLLKPSGGVPHAGGVIWGPEASAFRIVRDWIAQGVRADLDRPRVQSIEITPQSLTIDAIGGQQQFAVIAAFADGSRRDVTAEAFIDSNSTDIATVNAAGLLTAHRRGEATMLARYEGAYAASTVIVMGDRGGFTWKPLPVRNFIDELVDAKLKRIKVQLGELCTDEEFIRRVHLDLTGLPPTADDVRAFLDDTRETFAKREAMIDRLIGSANYIDHWTNKWSDMLQVNRKYLGEKGADALREWIRNAVAANRPYDDFAFAILTASGSNLRNPPSAYFKIQRTPEDAMETTTQLFLAIRFNCNKCHDHPFERWTQDQYYQMAAFFAQIQRMEDPAYKGQKVGGTAVDAALPLVEVIGDVRSGDVTHQRTGAIERPRFPFEHADTPIESLPRRTRLAHWVVSERNPYFARSYVNRIWSYLTGVGLIEPVDDIRAGNPPSNPELLNKLTEEFVSSGFDTQALIRTICSSRTYQLSIATNRWNADDETNYARALPRRLPAEVLFDAAHAVTGSVSRLPGLPPGARAAQVADGAVDVPGGFLELLGKPARESVCECERSNSMMLGPVLAFINGPVISDAVHDPGNRITALALAQKDDRRVVEDIYLSILNRFPTEEERKSGIRILGSAGADFERMQTEHRGRVQEFEAYAAGIDQRQALWEERLLDQRPTAWLPILPTSAASVPTEGASTRLGIQIGGSVLARGKARDIEQYQVTAAIRTPKPVTAFRLEVLTDASLPAKGPGRARNGNFVLNEFRVARQQGSGEDPRFEPLELREPQATFQQDGFPIAAAIDGNLETGWAIAPKLGVPHAALVRVKSLDAAAGVLLRFEFEQRFGTAHSIGKLRLSYTTDEKPMLKLPVSRDLFGLVSVPKAERTAEQAEEIRRAYLRQDRDYARLKAAAAKVPPAQARVLGAQDLAWALLNSPAFLFNR